MKKIMPMSMVSAFIFTFLITLAVAEPPHISTSEEKGLTDHIHPSQVQDGNIPEGVEIADHEANYWDKIEWGLIADGVLMGNTDNHSYPGQVDAVYGLDLEALFPCTQRGAFYILLEAGGGDGPDARIPTFSGLNDHAWGDDSIQLSQLWYEHRFLNNHLRFRFGKIDLTTDFDTNAYANCEHEQFLSGGFINNLAVDFPDYSPGGMIYWEPSEKISFGAGYQSNSEWDDIFRNGFGILQLAWHPTVCERKGNYRFYLWASAYDEITDPDTGSILSEAFTNYGWGISCDQELSAHFAVWCRYGHKPNEDFNSFQSHFSAGFHIMNLAYRPDDTLGLGYGIAVLSDPYSQLCHHPGDEHHLEFYYRAKLHQFFSMTFNCQWVKNPEGDADKDDVILLGLRATFMM